MQSRERSRRIGFLALGLLPLGLGCGQLLANEGFEIDCQGQPCDWQLVEGEPAGTVGWHDGDPALDLSGSGRVVYRQRSAPVHLFDRDLLLEASIVRSPGATLRFELAWYDGGASVDTRSVTVDAIGVFRWQKLVSAPPGSIDALELSIIKEGSGRVVVDELALGPYYGESP
jgi:hypothetical protein